MAEAFINLTEGSGKKAHAWDRTIGANTVLDEFTLPGEYPLASYRVVAHQITLATLDSHVLQLMAGSSLNVRIRTITVEQVDNATAAAIGRFQLLRLTTAGTGGTVVTPAKLDTGDAASGATAMTLPSSKGTESTVLLTAIVNMRQGFATAGSVADDNGIVYVQHPGMKPIIIAAGTANGVTLKIFSAAVAGASVTVNVEFIETSFL